MRTSEKIDEIVKVLCPGLKLNMEKPKMEWELRRKLIYLVNSHVIYSHFLRNNSYRREYYNKSDYEIENNEINASLPAKIDNNIENSYRKGYSNAKNYKVNVRDENKYKEMKKLLKEVWRMKRSFLHILIKLEN